MIFKRRQIAPYFLGALAAVLILVAGFIYSYKTAGDIPYTLGLLYILVMALCLVFMVLGMMEMTYWREEKRYLGIAGCILYTLVFLCMLAFYVAGTFLVS